MEVNDEMKFSQLPLENQVVLLFKHNRYLLEELERKMKENEKEKNKNDGLSRQNLEFLLALQSLLGKKITPGKINNMVNQLKQSKENYEILKQFVMDKQLYGEFKQYKSFKNNKK